MSEVTKPIALDESFNTTGQTPKNLADVMKNGLQEIAQAIDSHQGGGGHVILDQNGNALDQEPNMQFVDAHTSDDSTNSTTKIENIKPVTRAQFEVATEDGFYEITDEDDATMEEASADYVEVTADGEKTIGQLLNQIFTSMDFSDVDSKSVITLQWSAVGKDTFQYVEKTDELIRFTCAYADNNTSITTITLKSNNSTLKTSNNGTITDNTSAVLLSGYKITLHYGTDSCVTNLINQAKYTYMESGETVESAVGKLGIILSTISSSVVTIANAISNIYNQLSQLNITEGKPVNYSVFWTGHDRYYGEAILYGNNAHLTLIGYNSMYICDVDNGSVSYKTVTVS